MDLIKELEVELLKIELLVDKPIVMETLNRIGIVNFKEKIIYPSCYLYSNNANNYLIHFKQMFLIRSKESYNNMSLSDIERRNAIAFCLKKWSLIEVDESVIVPHQVKIDIIPYNNKSEWTIKHKIDLRIGC